MYHGSKTLINGYLEPKISFEMEPLVYATDDYYYALLRSGNFNIENILIREEYEGINNKIQLAEVEPGAFKFIFDRPGYIYEVEEDSFIPSRGNEFVSEQKVKIKNTIFIDNILSEIINSDRFELIDYDNTIEYWKNVKGGKQGYIERKQKVISNLKKLGAI